MLKKPDPRERTLNFVRMPAPFRVPKSLITSSFFLLAIATAFAGEGDSTSVDTEQVSTKGLPFELKTPSAADIETFQTAWCGALLAYRDNRPA